MTATLELLDWKRRVFALYAAVRAEPDPRAAWRLWRAARDELAGGHPQSPLEPRDRSAFGGLDYFDYDPALRLVARLEPVEALEESPPEDFPRLPALDAPLHAVDRVSRGEAIRFRRVGTLALALPVGTHRVEAYWLDAYGGGLFVPFRDATGGDETYVGGRYLIDTVKGADLGATPGGELVLDLNFAYNPSCVYSTRWACPLSPPANALPVPVRAGERLWRPRH